MNELTNSAEDLLLKVEKQEIKLPFKKILPFFFSNDKFVRIAFLETLYLYEKYEKKYAIKGLFDSDILVRITASDVLADCIPNEKDLKLLRKIFLSSREPIIRRNLACALARSKEKDLVSFFEQKIKTNKNENVLAGIFLALIMLGQNQYTDNFIKLLNAKQYQVICFVANTIGYEVKISPFIKQCLELKQKDGTNSVAVAEAIQNALSRINESEKNC